ncbi:Uncharacterised protein [Yersinia aldovae]|nr:Uncharacterised protein [Yersinia aldovae]
MCPWQREQADRKDAVNPSLARTLYSSAYPLSSRSRPRDMSAVWINQLANGYTQ